MSPAIPSRTVRTRCRKRQIKRASAGRKRCRQSSVKRRISSGAAVCTLFLHEVLSPSFLPVFPLPLLRPAGISVNSAPCYYCCHCYCPHYYCQTYAKLQQQKQKILFLRWFFLNKCKTSHRVHITPTVPHIIFRKNKYIFANSDIFLCIGKKREYNTAVKWNFSFMRSLVWLLELVF